MNMYEGNSRVGMRRLAFAKGEIRDLLATFVASVLFFVLLEISGACDLLLEMTRTTPAVFHLLVFAASGGFGLLLLAWLHRRRMVHHARRQARDHRRKERVRASIARAEAGCRASIASLGHDLRTPLNAIIGYSEIIADDELILGMPEAYREYARHISRAGHDLSHMVQDLLNSLQEFQALATREIRPVCLYDTLDRMAERMRALIQARDVRLAISSSCKGEDGTVASHPLLMATMLDGFTRFLMRLAAPKSSIMMHIEPTGDLTVGLRVRLRPGRTAQEQIEQWRVIGDLSHEDDGWTSRPADPALHALRGGLLLCQASLEGPVTTPRGELEFRLFLPRWKGKREAAAARHPTGVQHPVSHIRLLQQG